VAAGFGQESPDKEKKAANEFQRSVIDDKQDFQKSVLQGAVDEKGDEKAEAAKFETERAIKQAHAEVEQLSAEMAKIQAALAQAKERLGSLEKGRAGGYIRSVTPGDIKAAKKLWNTNAKKDFDDVKAEKADFVRWSIASRADASPDDRLNRLEKQVKSILAEIQEMKGQKQDSAAPKQP
jgi:hypothetical protein